MPRVPRPDELPNAQLIGAGNPAQIDDRVMARIGQSGRQMGNAIQAIGDAFGEVIGRVGQANDATADANAKLEWLKGDNEIQTDLAANAGEDGAAWQTAPDRYKELNARIEQQYPIGDPARNRSHQMWRETQTFNRGTAAVRTYQDAQRGVMLKGFEGDVAGVEDKLAKGEVDPATFGEYYGALTEKLEGMDRKVLSRADVEAKTRELQGRLTMSLDRYLSSKAPEERASFWDSVAKGRYEVDAAKPVGPQSSVQGLGTVSAKYESGGRGVGFISSGEGDPGGKSYGIHQLSGAYSMGAFLRSKEGEPYRAAFGGAKPQSDAFNRVYKDIASKDPEGFATAQKEFYTRTHYQPVRQHAEQLGFNTSDRGVQEALFSMSVQHEGARRIVSAAKAAAGASPQQQIQALYEARTSYVSGLGSLPASTKASVLNRYRNEVRDALALSGQAAPATAEAPRARRYVIAGPFWSSATQVAAAQPADPAVKSDAVQPPPGMVLTEQPGNDNAQPAPAEAAPALSGPLAALGEAGAKITVVANDQPDTPLSEVIDAEQIAKLGETYPAFQSIDDPSKMTVGEFAELAKNGGASIPRAPATQAAGTEDDADGGGGGDGGGEQDQASGGPAPMGVAAQPIVTEMPRGRLSPGQSFTVRTPRGEFKVPSEWINAIPEKSKAEYARRAREDLKVYERQLKTTADEMMKSQEAHVAEFGRDAPDYDQRAVQAAYKADPAKIAKHASRIRMANEVYKTLADAPDLPDDEVVGRLETLRPKPGTARYVEAKDIFDKAEERVIETLKQREMDPAGSVEKSRLVTGVRERLVGGRPRNALDQVALIDSRLKAQAALEIGEDARRPLPTQEAKALAAPLRGAGPEAMMERLEATHASIKQKYGERYSGLIVRQVIETAVKDKEKAKTLGAVLSELDETGKVSPTTLSRIRANAEVTRYQEQMGPYASEYNQPSIMDRLNTISKRFGATMPDFGGSNPFPSGEDVAASRQGMAAPKTPPPAAIEFLRSKPETAVEFEKKFGMQPGSATRYLAR